MLNLEKLNNNLEISHLETNPKEQAINIVKELDENIVKLEKIEMQTSP